MNLLDVGRGMLADWSDPRAWGHLTVPFPQRPTLWFGFIAILAVFAAVVLGIRLLRRRMPGREFAISVANDLTGSDWNVVRINLGDARNILRNNRLNQNEQVPAIVTIGANKKTVRLEMRQITHNTLQMSTKMGEELGFGLGDRALPAKAVASIRVPPLRWDIQTIKNPDPAIRLQWQLGFLFFILGIVLPKVLDTVL